MTPQGPYRRRFWLGVALILLAQLWWRGHTFGPALRDRLGLDLYPVTSAESEPLDCDEAIYGYIGGRLVNGAVMYRDLTENKPPGGYWIYALAVRIGGPTELTVRLLPLPFVLFTTVLVGWLGLTLRGPTAGQVGAFLFALLSTDPFLYGESANMEHLVNAFAFGSLACMVAAWGKNGRGWIVAAGVAVGAAFLIKQTAALHGPVYVAALMLRGVVHRDGQALMRSRPSRSLDVLALGAGFVSVLAVAALVLVRQGAWDRAYQDIVHYGGALASETPAPPNAPVFFVRWVTGNADPQGNLPWPFGRTDYLVWWGTGTWPVWLAGLPATVMLLWGKAASGPLRLLALWTACAWVQVALPGLFWQHYYLLPLPGLAASVAVVLVDCLTCPRRPVAKWVASMVVGLAVIAAAGWTVRLQFREYLLVPPEDLVRDRGGRQWVVNRQLGREIGRRAVVWERPTLFVWGWQGPLYFYSGLDGVTSQVFVDDFLKNFAATRHPLVRPRIERTMRDLHASPPSLVFTGYPPFPELRTFLDNSYLPSRLAPGLWVEKKRYADFENVPVRR